MCDVCRVAVRRCKVRYCTDLDGDINIKIICGYDELNSLSLQIKVRCCVERQCEAVYGEVMPSPIR